MKRSRLSKHLERKTEKSLIISILGIILVLGFLAKFGLPFLINFTLFISGTKQKDSQATTMSSPIVAAPVLNPIPNATNSAIFTITGNALGKDQAIDLYVNNELINNTKTEDDGSFTFANIKLAKGSNTIKTKAKKDNSSSDFSNQLTISYKDTKPSLSIDAPEDGKSFSKDESPITVLGKTDTGNRITINGFWAIVDSEGKFSYALRLSNGDNKITVVVKDDAGNETSLERKVTYSQ